MNNRKYTSGLKATERDLEYLENKLNLSRSNIYRLAIREF